MKVYRGMMEDDNGRPLIDGRNPRRCLRAKVGEVSLNQDGSVEPGHEGISVSPPPPENLPEHRRPECFGGSGKDPVWELDTDELPNKLAYRPDPSNPDEHGFIEPAYRMTFERYQQALGETSELWRRV